MTNPQPFDANDFLVLASKLAESPGQAELRSAVSRAYYAVFLHAREILHASGAIEPTRRGSDHALVIRALRGRSRADGNLLQRLRMHRAFADYDLTVPIGQAETQRLVRIARRLYGRL